MLESGENAACGRAIIPLMRRYWRVRGYRAAKRFNKTRSMHAQPIQGRMLASGKLDFCLPGFAWFRCIRYRWSVIPLKVIWLFS
jgi:hypothetical protein